MLERPDIQDIAIKGWFYLAKGKARIQIIAATKQQANRN